jgi:AAA+ ATPase superfamily predicted ATPase
MLLKHFQQFFKENQPYDMERLVEFYSVFGGSHLNIDIDDTLENQIIAHILENYGERYNAIASLLLEEKSYAKLLRAIAKGDRREHSALNRAHLSQSRGQEDIEFLIDLGLLEKETSREAPIQKEYAKQKLPREIARHKISDKLIITIPYIRFWFYFVVPHHYEIIKGEYEPFLEHFSQQKNSFNGYTYEQLCHYLLHVNFKDDPIIEAKSYWDRNVEIDILAQTTHGKIIMAECKWTNHKMNKKELSKLREKFKLINLEPNIIALFSKRGFSNELDSMRSDTLLLFDASDLQQLLN